MTQYFVNRLKSLGLKDCMLNLGRNWYIPLSAAFFLLSNLGLPAFNNSPVNSYYSFIPAMILIVLASSVSSPFSSVLSKTSFKVMAISLIDSFGICYCTWDALKNYPFIWGGDTMFYRRIFMVLAVPFVFVICILFWNKLEKVISNLLAQAKVKRIEWLIYLFIFCLICAFITLCFLNSTAFHGEDYNVDIIYTSDSHKLLKNNAFIVFDHIENDFRQPLFAVFSAPFAGIPCLIGSLIPGVPMALPLAYVQAAMILFSVFVLSYELKLNSVQRICFFLLSSATYTILVFSVVIEQYATAFFYLILTIHLIRENKKDAVLSSYGASGSLLVSGAFVPFVFYPEKGGSSNIIRWIKEMALYALDFCLLIVMAGRFHVLWNSVQMLKHLSKFSGESVSFSGRILQYVNFIGGCFFAPDSCPVMVDRGYYGWQLAEVITVNVIGMVVFALAIAGFFVTRKSFISKISIFWICMSFLVLVIVGWGISENGLFLYSLYFGWPFIVLIFGLVKYIEEKLKTKLIIPLFSIALTILMLVFNIPVIIEMLVFAIFAFPV